MEFELVKLTSEYKTHLFDMMDEWTASGEKIIPTSLTANDYKDFDCFMRKLCHEKEHNGIVPETTYFCLDIKRNIFVGAVTIRHYLTEKLRQNGGLIGDGIRPSERRKGYATAMIGLALKEAKKHGIDRVLMCCEKQNIASAKSIMNNGGVLDSEYEFNGVIKQRYWIDNK